MCESAEAVKVQNYQGSTVRIHKSSLSGESTELIGHYSEHMEKPHPDFVWVTDD